MLLCNKYPNTSVDGVLFLRPMLHLRPQVTSTLTRLDNLTHFQWLIIITQSK